MSSPTRAAPGTIAGMLAPHAGAAPAIRDVDGGAMTYGQLRAHADAARRLLNSRDIGPGDAVAMVLSNGPQMAAAFTAVASATAAAPLHPGLREREFRESLDSLDAKALVVEDSTRTPAAAVAVDLGIPILTLETTSPSGGFRLRAGKAPKPAHARPTVPADTALLLHTSGTTARPKLVPLSHTNLTASARNVAASLNLGSEDVCLNIMPLFHIHGLVGVLLASLHTGASVAATPGFHPMRFFRWLDAVRPTWYSAVPTMHQAILQRARRNPRSVARSRLRLVRSSSAALPPSVLSSLEATFGCPVIEAYGMTEASHQMAANPLPPGTRKPGTVGIAAGPEVAVMDASGNVLASGETGEVVIRGANVTAGYVDNPDANESSFSAGWFRTGDQGFRDDDGYFTITGRLKELINRGGEKISPREIDEVLLEHPAVAQAVAFAAPHERLGEEVGAAIVLEDGTSLTRRELRDFAARHLAAHKVPRIIRILDAIPKGPSGKLKRVGLARDLGIG